MMKINKILFFGLFLWVSTVSYAEQDGHLTRDAVIGGGLGGAAGGAIGAEVGGREGAIIGSAAGAALGTAITTGGSSHHPAKDRPDYDPKRGYYAPPPTGGHPHVRHCPPGQAKKGRC